jgi:hypothetical protein
MRISDLLEARVETEDGESRGHVHDVRGLRVLGLVIGGRGIRERLGIDTGRTEGPTVERDFIEWERVVRVDGEAGRVVVRA